MAFSCKPQLCVFVLFMLTVHICLGAAAEVHSEVASPPLDANIVECIQDKVTLGLCVHKEMLNYITTKKLDFTACCQIVNGITADCYPFVTTDPIFGLIYDKFCKAAAPSPPQQN